MTSNRFTTIRQILLLGVFLALGGTALYQLIYSRLWVEPLAVTIYPINGDHHLATDEYIKSLSIDSFSAIERWMQREAERFDLSLDKPITVSLGSQIDTNPPDYPVYGTSFDVLVWGLKMRYWAWRNTPENNEKLTHVRIFVIYHDPNGTDNLTHSIGLQKGLIGLVNAFASRSAQSQNNIVIAHELLHTVGATDKYEHLGSPVYPVGYANPDRQPLFPQRYAEIMAGRIPVSHQRSYMAESLKSVLINPYTAREINWLE